MEEIKCTKTLLYKYDDTISFTKGKTYTAVRKANTLENTVVINNQGEHHRLGLWAKYFKVITKK